LALTDVEAAKAQTNGDTMATIAILYGMWTVKLFFFHIFVQGWCSGVG
jgi:hypothetical protein